jgi:protein-S-isoprenylcysteine O-methyltransferase Ste14
MDPIADDRSGVKILPPVVALIGILIGGVLNQLWPVPILPASWSDSLRLGGLFLIAMWLALAISAVVTFRRAGTTPNPTKPTTALAFGGPYKFTRNPMYLGLFLLVVGTGFVLNSIWPVLMAVPVLLVLRNAVILQEEAYLERKFGEAYTEYKARVRRWL